MDQSNIPRSRKNRINSIQLLKTLLIYIVVPVALLIVLAEPIRDTVLFSEPAVFWILLAALGAVVLNWLIFALIHRKRPSLLVFADGILCLLIVVLIEQFSFPGYYSIVSTLAEIGGFLALAFLFILSFWLAACHNKAAHSTAVVIWVLLFLTFCFMCYQVARDFESRIVNRDTWITIGSIAAMILAACSPWILSSYRRFSARRKKTGCAEGRIVQIIGESHLDRFDEMVTRYHARVQYTVNEISYEAKAHISKLLSRRFGRNAFIGREVPVFYDPENPADAFISPITRKLLADLTEADLTLEKSCGAIVFTRRNGQLLYVIVKESSGAYSFPKGHVENNETEIQTATREIYEETGLRPVFLDGFRETDTYDLREKPGTRKQVVYFLAEFHNEPLIPRPGEITEILLLPYEEAEKLLIHPGTFRVLAAADRFLANR